jgi:anti-anti-sigma regulatory factor
MAVIAVDASPLPADATTVDALARLKLAASRRGDDLVLLGASNSLRELLELVGLSEVLGLEPRRKAEQGEQPLGVEEERELDDLLAGDLDYL